MNVLLVEDELHTATMLRDMIESDPDFLVVEKLDSITDTVAYLGKYQKRIDLVFLDIQLSDGHAFEIFRHVDIQLPVVFCTAYDEYSLEAIKSNGIDYILKPFRLEEVQAALDKYRMWKLRFSSNKDPQALLSVSSNYQTHFLTDQRGRTLVKKAEEVAVFHLEMKTVYLYTWKGEKCPLFKNLEYVESVCDPLQYFRINRQTLVNREAIKALAPYFNRKVVLELKVVLPQPVIVSRLKVTPFKTWLEGTGR